MRKKVLEKNWIEGEFESCSLFGHQTSIYCLTFDVNFSKLIFTRLSSEISKIEGLS